MRAWLRHRGVGGPKDGSVEPLMQEASPSALMGVGENRKALSRIVQTIPAGWGMVRGDFCDRKRAGGSLSDLDGKSTVACPDG